MTEHVDLNNEWKYSKSFRKEMTDIAYDESDMEVIRLPHANIQTPFHYFDDKIYQFVSCYRRHIKVKKSWRGKQVLLTFEGVGHVATIYINGIEVCTHYGGYTAFTVDVAKYLNYPEDRTEQVSTNRIKATPAARRGNRPVTTIDLSPSEADNVLTVEVDSRESCNLPPFGNVIDYLTYGGIYREVALDVKEQISIEDIFIQTEDTLEAHETAASGRKEVKLQLAIHGYTPDRDIKAVCSVKDTKSHFLYENIFDVTGGISELCFPVTGAENWEITHPVLYHFKLTLVETVDDKKTTLDDKTFRFGFRTCEFRKDGFYLNHQKVKIIGLNRHQSYPYVGYAMPKRIQQMDADILKHELQVNAVRTSHYPQSKHFIERCDELGLLVFTEIPGWQHIGDDEWKKVACENVREMLLQYRNHPSIILWGVRINESQDDDEFYRKTNEIAHQLDQTRQTGGVRFLQKSSLLEDVYTYNDFLHNGTNQGLDRKENVTSDKNVPYMVTEFNGHMFPTKSFDDEEHRLQHALRHARVLDALFGQSGIAGGFGWCMFDYNTHQDFGSGDKICYHGVLDMFRNPKPAAAVYASQSVGTDVFEISSTLDIGEHPAGNIKEIYAFTNADSVKLYKNDIFVKEFFPAKETYQSLPHPPVIIDDFVGGLLEEGEHLSHKTAEAFKKVLFAVKKYGPNHLPLKYKLKMAFLMLKEHLSMQDGTRLYYQYIGNWGGAATTFRFEAVKSHQVVKVIEKKPAGKPVLIPMVSHTILHEEETYDAVEIRIVAADECGNRLPYYQEPITVKVWGTVELIGPETISLKGGATGIYIKTKGIIGEGGVIIRQAELGDIELKFVVE